MRPIALLCLARCALAAPPPPAEPPEFEWVPRTGLMITGASLFAGGYLVSVATAVESGDPQFYIPLLGPIFALAPLLDEDGLVGPAMLLLGGTQIAGVALFTVGLNDRVRRRVKVYETLPPERRTGMAITGAALLGVGWVASSVMSLAADGELNALAVPVAGPVIVLAQRGGDCEYFTDRCLPGEISAFQIGVAGVLQVAGIVVGGIGLVPMERRRRVAVGPGPRATIGLSLAGDL